MPNVCFEIIAFNTDAVLEECIKSLLPYGKVIAAEGPTMYWQRRGFTTSTDRTNAILHDLLGTKNVLHGQWQEKDDEVNAPIALIPYETTHVFAVDCDEIIPRDTMEGVLSQLDNYDSVSLTPLTFFGSLDHVLTGFETRFTWYRIQRWFDGAMWATHRPPTVLAPDGRPWREHRHWNSPYNFFHYSYVFADSVREKTEYYQSRTDCIPNYFRDVWLKWTLGNEEVRHAVEDEYDGVHEWRKELRGDCRTQKYDGSHPLLIQLNITNLRERFSRELNKYR